jgi:peptide/nickel transport system substrate-binding protein
VQFNLAQEDPAFFAKTLFYAAAIVDSAWAIENGMWDGTEATWRDWIGVDCASTTSKPT